MGAAKEWLGTAGCPIARTVDVVGDRWSLLILRDVFDGITRFGSLQRSLGLSRNVLTDRLRALVAHGVLTTRPASDGTSYHEYALTDRGADLFTVLVGLRQWGERHLFADGEPHSDLLTVDDDRPLRRLEPVDAAGEPVAGSRTYVRTVAAPGG